MSATMRGKFHALAEGLRPQFTGEILEKVSMRAYTSFRIGGLGELMVFPKTEADLARVVDRCREEEKPWRVLGAGTNLLVRDGGVEEVLINLSRGLDETSFATEGRVEAGVGLRLARLVKLCQMQGLSGIEFAAGIPGTVGGAVAMNAGAMGSEMAAVLEKVRAYVPGTGFSSRPRRQLKFSYRHFEKPAEAILTRISLALVPGDPKKIREKIIWGLRERRQSQPLSHPSAGSVFKNPPGDYAGRLIEEAEFKGLRIGDAQVSDKHANFIVNRGRARSRDVLALVEQIREKVEKDFGVRLELEVEVIGKD